MSAKVHHSTVRVGKVSSMFEAFSCSFVPSVSIFKTNATKKFSCFTFGTHFISHSSIIAHPSGHACNRETTWSKLSRPKTARRTVYDIRGEKAKGFLKSAVALNEF